MGSDGSREELGGWAEVFLATQVLSPNSHMASVGPGVRALALGGREAGPGSGP